MMPSHHHMRHVALPLVAHRLALPFTAHCLALPFAAQCLALPFAAQRLALPFAATPTVLLCPCHHASCASLPCLYFFFSFSGNFLFCSPVTVLSPPSLPTDAWPSSPKAYHGAITYRDDNATATMTLAEAAHGMTATMIATPHSTMT
jgi:hypothetical protein